MLVDGVKKRKSDPKSKKTSTTKPEIVASNGKKTEKRRGRKDDADGRRESTKRSSKTALPKLGEADPLIPGRALPLLERRPGWDSIFFFFFLTHAIITVTWHSQMIFPTRLYPKILQDLTKTYSRDWQDPLNFSHKTPVWYLSIIYCEVFLQFPFHLLAIYVFGTGSHNHPWFRIPSIMYSIHVATTFMPIFAYLTSFDSLTPCGQTKSSGQTQACALGQTLRLKLIAVYYAPFFLIPLRLLTFSVFRTYDADSYVDSLAENRADKRADSRAGAVDNPGKDGQACKKEVVRPVVDVTAPFKHNEESAPINDEITSPSSEKKTK